MRRQPRTLTSAEEMRLCAGFVAQPFVASLMAFVCTPLLLLGRTGAGVDDAKGAAISIALGTFMFAIGVTLVCVVPAAIWVLKRRPLTFTQTLLVGFAIGNLPIAIGGAASVLRHPFLSASRPIDLWAAVGTVVFSSLLGVTGAAAFWVISIRGRDFSREPAESI